MSAEEALAELELELTAGPGRRALLALPAAAQQERAPAVLIARGAGGLDAAGRLARALAGEGFVALAPELDAEGGRTPAHRRGDREVVAELEAAAAWLQARAEVDRERVAVLGLEEGGTRAFLLGCHSRRLAAVVDVGGALAYAALDAARPVQPLELALNLSAPFQGHFGARGDVPPDEVERAAARLDQFARDAELHVYPRSGRELLAPLGGAPGVAAEAELAWARILAFLRT